ncbi:hypothetical protein Q3G72_022483 [Acer saccharum]|nr:hypothetical protein Q3G72_022483 [Acer saccharum]
MIELYQHATIATVNSSVPGGMAGDRVNCVGFTVHYAPGQEQLGSVKGMEMHQHVGLCQVKLADKAASLIRWWAAIVDGGTSSFWLTSSDVTDSRISSIDADTSNMIQRVVSLSAQSYHKVLSRAHSRWRLVTGTLQYSSASDGPEETLAVLKGMTSLTLAVLKE